MLLLPSKKYLIFLFIIILLISAHGLCRTPVDLDRIIDEYEHSKNPEDQLKLAYLGLDLYAPITQKSEVDPGDRITLSQMKRLVLTNAIDRAGNDILITAVGTTGYWVLERMDRIVNNYPADDQDRIVQLKRKGCYMEGLSDLDFVIMGPNAAVYKDNLYRIFAEGTGNVHLVPDELDKLEISFITDDQIKNLAPGPKGRKFWDQLMNLEQSSPHPEKYITKGGKALYGMEHLYEEGAVALSNKSQIPELFNEYANKAGHHMGPFTLAHLFGGSCDMDYFLTHALEKSSQENIKTILQIIKYLKRQEWMLKRSAKNINKLPSELPNRPDTVKSLENYASEIASFVDKAVDQKIWKSPQAAAQFGKEARVLSGVISSFAHECLIDTGDDLLTIRKNKRLTDETRSILASIVFDLITVDEERYPHGYPSWYAVSGDSGGLKPRDKTLDFLKRYSEGEADHKTDGPVIAMPDVKKKNKMDTGPILPPPAAHIQINKVDVSPQKPLAGAPATFTITGSVRGISDKMPDFTKNEYSDDQQNKMEALGLWSLRATIYRMQIQYLMEQDLLSKQASSTTDKIFVSPYEIAQIAEDFLEPAEDEIARLSQELEHTVTDKKSGKYAFRVRPVPSAQSIKDYLEALEDTCKQAKKGLDIFYNFAFSLYASIDMMYEYDTSVRVTGINSAERYWDNESMTYRGRNRSNDNNIDKPRGRPSAVLRLAEIRDDSEANINLLDKTIEYAGELKKRVEQLEGLMKADPSTAAEIADEIKNKLMELAESTTQGIIAAQTSNVELVSVITQTHKLMENLTDSEQGKEYRKKALSVIEQFDKQKKELNEKTLPELKEKSVWLKRGAWAAWGVKWGFEALDFYKKYQEDKKSLSSTDLSSGTENAVLALGLAGKAIEKVLELIPIPVLESTLKSYSKLLSDSANWASAMDSLQAMRYQDQDFETRMAVLPAAYQSLLDKNPDLEPGQFYRTRMPMAEYNGITILAYPMLESTETGSKPRDRMWLIWDKHLPDGYLLLDKSTFERMSLYTAWYRRVYGENISGEDLHALITKGKFETGYVFKETVTPDSLKFKAATILRIKALEAYFFSLTGNGKFKEEELYTYMSMLYHAAGEFAKKGFLLTDPDVKVIMETVFFEKPIQGNWKTVFDIFSMSYGSSDRVNDSAATWDKLSGGEKERLEEFLSKFIQKKVEARAKEREKSWKEARVREESDTPLAAGLLYSETGLVFKHAFFSKAGDIYADDYQDINSENFTITWETVMPNETDITTATYVCVTEISGYPDTRVEFALPIDTQENDILKQMIELAEKAEEIGGIAWSLCQGATSQMDSFAERKDDFILLLDELKKMNQAFDSIQQQAGQAPDLLKRNSMEARKLSDEILKNLTEIEKLKAEICEASGSTNPGEKQKQAQLIQQLRKLMENIRLKSQRFEKLFEESEKAMAALKAFEKVMIEYDALLNESSGWARGLSDGFAKSLSDLTDVGDYIKELSRLKNKADELFTEAKNTYSAPESRSTLEEIQKAHARVERPLKEVKDCLNLANEKKAENLPLYEKIGPELTQAGLNFKNASQKWINLDNKKEDMETLSQEISDLWHKTQAQILKAENYMTEAEVCMGDESSTDVEGRVPDLLGMTMTAAKNRVTTAGFKPVLSGGDPAPTQKQVFTVASQNPGAGEIQETGKPVTIILYGNFAGYAVPDVIGITSKEAIEKLERAGFKTALEGGDPAPSEDIKFKVQSQSPGAGEKAEQGSSVKIRIYGDVHYVLVPSVVNMTSSQAKSTMSSAGLVPSLFGGDPAPKKSMSYRVQDQSPAPGSPVLYGSTTSIHVYGDFNELTALANANCNNLSGSTLKWDYQNDNAICVCPSGMVINNAGNVCVDDPRIQQERDQRNQFWTAVVNTAVPIIINEITRDNNRTGGNTPGGGTHGGNTGITPSPPGGTNTTPVAPSTGSSGLSREECEKKFCPECTNSISMLGESVSPQCMDCRKRKKNDIEKCMSGEKTGPGTQHVAKEYLVICYLEYDTYLQKYVCENYEVVKVTAPITGRREEKFGPDTWDKCHAEEERLRGLIIQNNPLIRRY